MNPDNVYNFNKPIDNVYDESLISYQKKQDMIENLEREKSNLKNIKDFIMWHLDKHKHTRNDLTPMSVFNIANILLGYNGDIVIFNNGAHCVFDVWIDSENKKIGDTKKFIEYLQKESKWMLYAYRINGIDFIEQHPYTPNNL